MAGEEKSATTGRIAIGIVRRGDHVLVGRRRAGQALAGCEEFPGGKCLPGESPEECVLREVREETGLDIRVIRLRQTVEYDYPHGRQKLWFFDCLIAGESPPLTPFAWVPLTDLVETRFPPANASVIRSLQADSAPRGARRET